jgi:hypothetical protein
MPGPPRTAGTAAWQRDQRVGTRRVYQVDPEGLRLLRGYLDHFWEQALAAYKTAVEQQVKESE